MTPILFIHQGYSFYMEYTLRQCRYYNLDSNIYLLGDEENKQFSFLNHYKISELFDGANKFSKVYQHLSTNDPSYELFCFQRWFIVRDFMIRQKLQSVFICDTDLMIYKGVENFINWKQNNNYAAFCISNQEYSSFHWCASAHSSYWTLEGISAFCDYLNDIYLSNIDLLLSKWNFHLKNNIRGGVCDMTLLYLFYLENTDKIVNLLNPTSNNEVFDNNIGESHNLIKNEYSINRHGKKKIKFINNQAFCYNRYLERSISFSTLHFQGASKKIIHKFYQGPDPLVLQLFHTGHKIARVYKRFKYKTIASSSTNSKISY